VHDARAQGPWIELLMELHLGVKRFIQVTSMTENHVHFQYNHCNKSDRKVGHSYNMATQWNWWLVCPQSRINT